MLKIIKRILDENKKAWDSKLSLAIWADRVTVKKALGFAPFDIGYGIQAQLPHNNLMRLHRFIQKYDDEIIDDMQERMNELVGLDEKRKDASVKNAKLQLQMKHLFDRKIVERKFQVDELVLMWNAQVEFKGKHGKFDPIWLGPYLIDSKWGDDSYILKELFGGILELPVHGQFLKKYFS